MRYFVNRNLLWLFLLFCFVSCKDQCAPVPVSIKRFDRAVVQWIRSDFDRSKLDVYMDDPSLFFNIYCKGVWGFEGDMKELWLERLTALFGNDHLQRLCLDTERQFPDLKPLETSIGTGLCHLNRVLPDLQAPKLFYTHISGFQQSMVISDGFVSIALDKYLGADYDMYESYFYDYQRATMCAKYIPRDLFRLILLDYYPNHGADLLDRMIFEGKIVYALSLILPDMPVEELLGFSSEKLKWCKINEKSMWHYLIEQDFLYSDDLMLQNKFLNEAGFTNDFGDESPGRAISWIGYQIVQQYMDIEKVSVDQLFKESALLVMKESRYKY